MMLVETDPRRERQVGTHAHEHAAPSLVVDIEVELHNPALSKLQMPAVAALSPTAIMIRAGSRAFSTAMTSSGLAPLKYGSTNSSRRPFGASRTGTLRFSDHC